MPVRTETEYGLRAPDLGPPFSADDVSREWAREEEWSAAGMAVEVIPLAARNTPFNMDLG
jgi:hypothetical protein